MDAKIERCREEIRRLQEAKVEREAALPVHSVRSHQILAIEELEEEIGMKEAELRLLESRSANGSAAP